MAGSTTTLSGEFVDVIDGRSFTRAEHVACPICGHVYPSRHIDAQFGMTAIVAQCRACRIAYQTPRPSPEATLAYMNWRWGSSDSYVDDRDAQLKRGQMYLDFVHQRRARPGSLLDFGAGKGSFVHLARVAGWDAVGVERSDTARAGAKSMYGVMLEEELPERRFDVVTLWDVIEHLREPEHMLKALRRNLRPGGLVYIETGNWECWKRLVNRDKWHVYLFDHQYYFSPSSLGCICDRAGYESFEILDVNRARPPGLRHFSKMPRWTTLAYLAWCRARLTWPAHGDIGTLVAVARNSTDLSA